MPPNISSQNSRLRRNAIVCLIRGGGGSKKYANLIERNRSLASHYPQFETCDNLIFHEGNVPEERQEEVIGVTPNSQFVRLPPGCFSEKFSDQFLPHETRARIGYRHMCRFFGVQIFPLLESYEYYWRLDDDCILHGTLSMDPFRELRERGAIYGFVREKKDSHRLTAETLPNFSQRYLDEHFPDRAETTDVSVKNYYNNFHLSQVNFWFRPEVRSFLRAVEESGGIYKYRWGDSTIQAIALRMFTSPGERHQFSDIRYEHKSHRWKSF